MSNYLHFICFTYLEELFSDCHSSFAAFGVLEWVETPRNSFPGRENSEETIFLMTTWLGCMLDKADRPLELLHTIRCTILKNALSIWNSTRIFSVDTEYTFPGQCASRGKPSGRQIRRCTATLGLFWPPVALFYLFLYFKFVPVAQWKCQGQYLACFSHLVALFCLFLTFNKVWVCYGTEACK